MLLRIFYPNKHSNLTEKAKKKKNTFFENYFSSITIKQSVKTTK